MEMIEKTVKVPKEISEIAEGAANIVRDSYEALRDGFQIGMDLPVILTSTVSNLPSMVGGLDKLKEEWETARSKFILAWALAGERAYDEISAMMEAKKEMETIPETSSSVE